MYQMKYNYSSDENGNPTLVQIRGRLVKKEKNYQWISPIHEVIVPTGNVKKVDIAITHKKEEIKDLERNLRIFEKMIEEGKELDDRQKYSYAKEFYFLRRFEEAKVEYKKFLDEYEKDYQNKRAFIYPAILELADCYKNLNDKENQIQTLLKVLKYELPGSECCCKIGEYFLERKEYIISIFWFELAVENKKDIKKDGDSNVDYNEFIPYINLCVCYFWIGNKEKSYEYNEKAGKIKPQDKTYLLNKEILS